MNSIVCLGDSLTFGVNASGTLSKNLTTRLSEKYPRIKIVNMGIPGDTAINMYSRRATVNLYSPFRVIIWAGVNDIAIWGDETTTKSTLQSLYDYYNSLNYEVWACTITPVDTQTSEKNTIRDNVNTWIKTIATNVDRVIDTFTIIADPTDLAVRLPAYRDVASIVHLNDNAYEAIVSDFP